MVGVHRGARHVSTPRRRTTSRSDLARGEVDDAVGQEECPATGGRGPWTSERRGSRRRAGGIAERHRSRAARRRGDRRSAEESR